MNVSEFKIKDAPTPDQHFGDRAGQWPRSRDRRKMARVSEYRSWIPARMTVRAHSATVNFFFGSGPTEQGPGSFNKI